jgi:hypothetical protein
VGEVAKFIVYILVVPLSTTTPLIQTTTEPCYVTNGMADVNTIPNENIVNEKGVSIGDRARLTDGSRGYTPASSSDSISIKLSSDNSQIAIGQIIISAQNFVSAILSIKTTNDNTWKQYTTLYKNITTFDNLYATELQFNFTGSPRYIKLGVIGCFPPTGKKKGFQKY